MPVNSKKKGAHGERELAAILHKELGVELKRNLEQARGGGYDLVANGYHPSALALRKFALEVKRREKTTPALLASWWTQTVKQARESEKIPALAYRSNREPWRIMIPLDIIIQKEPIALAINQSATLYIDGFCILIRQKDLSLPAA